MENEIKNSHKPGLYEQYIKRPQDFLCSLLAIIVLSPVMLITAILVRIKLGSPVIFKQERPGRDGRIFRLYKFKSMTDQRDENGNLLPDEVRLTKFGRLLRSTSLDELPELVNILKGDMAVVGPRPLAVQYLPYYSEVEMHRHDVRPGLTGLAQARNRNVTTWEERFQDDLEYVGNITFIGDVKIIISTFCKVIKREDIGERGVDAPMDFDEYRRKQNKEKSI